MLKTKITGEFWARLEFRTKKISPEEKKMGWQIKVLILFWMVSCLSAGSVVGVEILSKSKLERCEKGSESDTLDCTTKIVLNMAVPSGSSGEEASIVAEIVEVEENSTNNMRTLRVPPVITINKSAVYALYELTYLRDVAYKPQELFVKTRKCEPNAGGSVVQTCQRLQDKNGRIIEYTEVAFLTYQSLLDPILHTYPICCPCGPQRRVPSSCGNFFDKMMKGKANTAHCLRFPGDWSNERSGGPRIMWRKRSIGFNIRILVKTRSLMSEVIVGPENKTATSKDNFLRVNLVGDFVGYSSLPAFEDFYLVIPRQGEPGQPKDLGRNFSMWMLLERVRFTLDGSECNKIGVNYEAFHKQPNFCSSPFWSCLHNQLWNYRDADQNRIDRKQLPLYGVEGRSPGKILNVTVPTFEALTQFGVATITTKNIGEVEASYSLTFDCSSGVSLMEEQFFIMKPNENAIRSFKLYPTTDQAAKYVCSAILKDSNFNEVDRAECQFSTTMTIINNGSQVAPFEPPKTDINGFLESIENIWKKLWEGLVDFITGKTCRRKCISFFDFSCHIQYICMSWMVMFGLLLAIFPTVLVLLWLLHQKGLFDPLYDWWEVHVWSDKQQSRHISRHNIDIHHHHHHHNIHDDKHHELGGRHHKHGAQYRQTRTPQEHRHNHSGRDTDYYYYLHHVHKDKSKHRSGRKSSIKQQVNLDGIERNNIGHHRHRKAKDHTRTI
ncbi:protein HAPLESS 2 isoform X3 [Jatropha curcas]|uniref:protein HAPLESS 2 isoform X3 n=1 Tax=Jatropha curcas TaxID=180498 RepID=UPI0009D6DA8F|nr:protein HAPLESS 2 isoform X3 [Jatropha curcas]